VKTSAELSTLLAALVAARGAFQPIHKLSRSSVGKEGRVTVPYADLATVLEAVQPALTAHGLVVLQSIDAETSTLVTRLVHVSGEWVESVYPLPANTDARAFGSALTYGRRYSIQALLCLTAADDDGDAAPAATGKPADQSAGVFHVEQPAKAAVPLKRITKDQQAKLFTIAEQAGWSLTQIRDYLKAKLGVEQSKDIPAPWYPVLCAAFNVGPDASDSDPA
jgi:hypothetical protein